MSELREPTRRFCPGRHNLGQTTDVLLPRVHYAESVARQLLEPS